MSKYDYRLKIGIFVGQIVKLIINSFVIHIYLSGHAGKFLGGSSEKNHNEESFICAVFIGYIIFNVAQLVSSIIVWTLDRENINRINILEVIINISGLILWIIAGGMSLKFWNTFELSTSNETKVENVEMADFASNGRIMGLLALINGGLYLAELMATFLMISYKESRPFQDEPDSLSGLVP